MSRSEALHRRLAILSLAALVAAGGLVGCGDMFDSPSFTTSSFQSALPSPDDVELRVPSSDPIPNGLRVGETARFYSETYNITRHINGTVYVILSILGDVVVFPPTSQTDDGEAVWGPYTPALEPATYKLTASEIGENEYEYRLEARPRTSTSEDDWVDIIVGEAYPEGTGKGHGSFTLDWSAMSALNPNLSVEGEMRVEYDHRELSWRDVEVVFTDFRDLAENPSGDAINGRYRYRENDDTSGDFQFAVVANLHDASEGRPLPEHLRIRSRWQASGSGRSDVRVESEEIAADLELYLGLDQDYVELSECWDDGFLRVWYDESPVALTPDDGTPDPVTYDGPGQGDPADCVFDDTEPPDEDIGVM
jgi:hypothetical protein